MSCDHFDPDYLLARVPIDSPEPRWRELEGRPVPVRIRHRQGRPTAVDGFVVLDRLDMAKRRAHGELIARRASLDGRPLELAGRFDAEICVPPSR